MDRFNSILKDDKYKYYLEKIKQHEVERRFCKHNLSHFFDVARIAYLLNLEQELGIDKEIIYTTALLHDIGRFMQYEEGIEHEVASWEIGQEFLKKYNFTKEESNLIKEGILGHRNSESGGFGKVLYEADKKSRMCIDCLAASECNWNEEKKNLDIYY